MRLILGFSVLISLFLGAGCSSNSTGETKEPESITAAFPTPLIIKEVSYIRDSRDGGIVAFTAGGRFIQISVKFDATAQEPYIEVQKLVDNSGGWPPKGEYVAWGLGGILHLRDYSQLVVLWKNKP